MSEDRICPLCGKHYSDYPALSRVLDEDICSQCGMLEAFIPQTEEGFIKLWSSAVRIPKNAFIDIHKHFNF